MVEPRFLGKPTTRSIAWFRSPLADLFEVPNPTPINSRLTPDVWTTSLYCRSPLVGCAHRFLQRLKWKVRNRDFLDLWVIVRRWDWDWLKKNPVSCQIGWFWTINNVDKLDKIQRTDCVFCRELATCFWASPDTGPMWPWEAKPEGELFGRWI